MSFNVNLTVVFVSRIQTSGDNECQNKMSWKSVKYLSADWPIDYLSDPFSHIISMDKN